MAVRCMCDREDRQEPQAQMNGKLQTSRARVQAIMHEPNRWEPDFPLTPLLHPAHQQHRHIPQLANRMQSLIRMKVDLPLTLGGIQREVQNQLCCGKYHPPGNQPHEARVNEAVRQQAMDPQPRWLRLPSGGTEMPALVQRQILPLEGIVRQRMSYEESEEQIQTPAQRGGRLRKIQHEPIHFTGSISWQPQSPSVPHGELD